ncbi:MAG: tRNA (adenosine(37)-N6)-threonylcarbamoyltransferase complex dimerization subunit type 1 TsaB [Candidatus Marinimicrobia bacterium]|nr:tRNA (adenosine(37)-N6)-threonylcarbamoyltransferase complex dimerization subunit type 1 TsaB [Candidatus Neomarinimicrobiota bacterium]
MLILAVETSSPVCGVSLCTPEGEKDKEVLIQPRVHAEKLAVICKDLLLRNSLNVSRLDGIAVSAGPGSFTGLRIGMSFVKGLAYAHQIPVAAVNTLFAFRDATRETGGAEEKTVWVIHSHRDFIYTLGDNEEDIHYMKKREFSDFYPRCRHIISNQAPGIFDELSQDVYPIMPAWIGAAVFGNSAVSLTTQYDQLRIYYGSHYEPVRWKSD